MPEGMGFTERLLCAAGSMKISGQPATRKIIGRSETEQRALTAAPLANFLDEETELHHGLLLAGAKRVHPGCCADADAGEVHLVVNRVLGADAVDHLLGDELRVG